MHQMNANEQRETVASKTDSSHEESMQDGESHSAPAAAAASSSSHPKRKSLSSSSSSSLNAAAAGALAPIEELEEEEGNESSPTTRSPLPKRLRLEQHRAGASGPTQTQSQTAIASTGPARWCDLPRDCLEAITGFLSLKKFAVASRVCREWSRTCEEAPSRNDTLVLKSLPLVVPMMSPLRRHISTLRIPASYPHQVQVLTPESLLCLSDRMPHLTLLTCFLDSPLRDANLTRVFPPRLRELDIKLCVYVPERQMCDECQDDIDAEQQEKEVHKEQDEDEEEEEDDDDDEEEEGAVYETYSSADELKTFEMLRRVIRAASRLPLVSLRVTMHCDDYRICTESTSSYLLALLKPLSATRDTLTKLEVIWPLREYGTYMTDVTEVAFLHLHRLVDLKLQFGRDPALSPIVYHRRFSDRKTTGHLIQWHPVAKRRCSDI